MNPPDRLEIGLRFGCGALVGCAFVAYALLRGAFDHGGWFGASLVGAAIMCGLLAVRYGDRFFEAALEWFTWPSRWWR